MTLFEGRTCAFFWARTDEHKYVKVQARAADDEDTDVIEEAHQLDDLTAVMRDVSNELRRVAETGHYKGVFVDPVVEQAAQAIKKLYEEAKAYRDKKK